MTDLRIQKSNRALLDTSFQVLLTNPHASLSEVAKQAGVGRATLYRHFPTREHLITAIAIESLQLVKNSIDPIVAKGLQEEAALHNMVMALLPLADRFHFLQMIWTVVEFDQKVLSLYENQMDAIKCWIIQGQKQGIINSDLAPDWIVSVIDSMLYSAAWLLANKTMEPTEIEQHLVQTLSKGIQSNKIES
ncbi:TetR/AcrR family transcriptional regulator [uncultured Neptuniibacter sp.]|uniref:TetR/AcrR family transcriptional regulator n=1 Tax=uncultured Neptuniibacter sp. TaxID=502143 RepID=UPI00260D880A|nr:TetR/AcrR family transcriptional regulator [uncultured Neptuniibacter sp.]